MRRQRLPYCVPVGLMLQAKCVGLLGVRVVHAVDANAPVVRPTREQASYLHAMGCVLQRGYLFARPTDTPSFEVV